MTSEIILLLLSGLGVLHGLVIAIFLWFYRGEKQLSNKLLSVLLLVISFRVGKSVILEFAKEADTKLIFTGLGTIMLIGPLYLLYARSLQQKSFKVKPKHLWHFLPALIAIILGLLSEEHWTRTFPVIFFIIMFVVYYTHYLFYFMFSHHELEDYRNQKGWDKDVYNWLKLLFFAFMSLWVVYVLNLLDEQIPYVIGPILYSIIVYSITFVAIRKGYISNLNKVKYSTTHASKKEVDDLFNKVVTIIDSEELFKSTDISLKTLSKKLMVTPQKLSMTINVKSDSNFNDFINHYRIRRAKQLMKAADHAHLTIASIAYDCGFNSLTSFNTAFKKLSGLTPSEYRRSLNK
ncbi:helix-turn-helix domain-containing protein [Fulvivirgaceae bacterium BMA10]|uniref:Helix-turn-helix domain-containing protein n=1 Tax=Splendidivirga corallicola TaxID=3051826 RepID=A0ABT8KNH5_9BACT|nr:helix-turn-helix domain-containing protein [Fulvivirgaceae bacterium BMA10]